jgi:hypothetical protein
VVILRDEGSVFEAPLDEVWRFLGSGGPRARAHHHRNERRQPLPENSATYSWEQDFPGQPVRFTMRWVAFVPLGIAYEVLAGPFEGSKFFLNYTPSGLRTEVSAFGEFTSKTIPPSSSRQP